MLLICSPSRGPRRSMLTPCARLPDGRARPQILEPSAGSRSRDDVALLLVEAERLLELLASVFGASRDDVDLRQIGERVAVPVEHVRLPCERDRFAGKLLGLRVLASPNEHFRAHLSPEHLRRDVVARRKRLGGSGPLVSLVPTVKGVERFGQLAHGHETVTDLAELLEQLAAR